MAEANCNSATSTEHRKEFFLRIPVAKWLLSQGMIPITEVWCMNNCDMVGVRFGPRTGRFIPAVERVVAVELKLENLAEVLYQASRHQHSSHASYAALPSERFERMTDASFDKFVHAGVGLISVSESGECQIKLEPVENPNPQIACRRTAWKRRDEFRVRMQDPQMRR